VGNPRQSADEPLADRSQLHRMARESPENRVPVTSSTQFVRSWRGSENRAV
jgi:hypothetical protein